LESQCKINIFIIEIKDYHVIIFRRQQQVNIDRKVDETIVEDKAETSNF